MYKNNEGLVFASCLFRLGVEHKRLDGYLEQFQFFLGMMEKNVHGMRDFLCAHRVSFEDKKRFMSAVFESVFYKELVVFLNLFFEKSNGKFLGNVFFRYQAFVDEYVHRARAVVYSVCELSEECLSGLRVFLKERFRKEFILKCLVDGSIIGGVVIYFEDKRVDLSLRHHLEGIYKNIVLSQIKGGV